MGWWSREVMGGDEPLDSQAELLRMFGLTARESEAFERQPKAFRDRLDAGVSRVRDELLSSGVSHPARRPVLWQVLGDMLLRAGAQVAPVCLRVLEGCDADPWANEGDSERLAVVEVLRGRIFEVSAQEMAAAKSAGETLEALLLARAAEVDAALAELGPDIRV